jgi:hypothetical protein
MIVSPNPVDPSRDPYPEFLLERYKYILDQKKNLNERTFKLAAVFQAAVIIIASAQYKIVTDIQSGEIDFRTGTAFCWSLLGVSFISAICFVALILGGLFSWLKYRSDEQKVEVKVFGVSRSAPALRDCFRWYETYLITMAVMFPVAHYILIYYVIGKALYG